MRELVIGTRGSKLALWQAGWVKERLEAAHPGLACRLETITTTGDKILDVALAKVGGKGLFVKEIEEALLAGRIDLAVHSMKDVPTELPAGLAIVAMTEREDPRDAVVTRNGAPLMSLPDGAVIGTSSLRRRVQLKHMRADFALRALRGNVDTRLRKLEEEDLDAVILAAAGLKRLGLADRIVECLTHRGGFIQGAGPLPEQYRLATRMAHHAAKDEPLALQPAEAPDGDLTPTFESAQKRPFSKDRPVGKFVVDGRYEVADPPVIEACLDA